MDFHELRAFVNLAGQLHFSKSAEALHMSPSALSRLVTRLEEELGTPLFLRDHRTVKLTPGGEKFLLFARESLSRLDELHLRLEGSDEDLRGILRVYASVTACYSILPALADLIRRDHPNLRLSVVTGDPAQARTMILEGQADLALAALGDKITQGLASWSVRKSPLVFAASKDGPFSDLELDRLPQDPAAASRIWARVLSTYPLILPARDIARERLERWCRDLGIRPKLAAETSGNEAVLALVRLGLGLGLVPRIVLENSPFSQGLVLYPGGTALGEYDIGFLFKKRSHGESWGVQAAVSSLLAKAYPKDSVQEISAEFRPPV